MAEISDELLMAYADGALDPSVRAIVEAALREDPRYREKVEKFRATRDPVRAAFQQDQGLAGLGPLIDRLRGDDVPLETAATIRTRGALSRSPALGADSCLSLPTPFACGDGRVGRPAGRRNSGLAGAPGAR